MDEWMNGLMKIACMIARRDGSKNGYLNLLPLKFYQDDLEYLLKLELELSHNIMSVEEYSINEFDCLNA